MTKSAECRHRGLPDKLQTETPISGSYSHLYWLAPNRNPSRGERGLTTLEWLLIVAAVAGLAALAVVLVQNVVDDTAEEISGNNARITAAKVAADRINSDAIDQISQKAEFDNANTISNKPALEAIGSEFMSKCERLEITYSDAKITADWVTSFNIEVAWSNSAEVRSGLESQLIASTNPTRCIITEPAP